MKLDSKIWGPHFWFMLHTIAIKYPKTPNDVTKKKYYEFISDIPLFLPDTDMGDHFAYLLDKYPLLPYLDSHKSFTKWIHFIHNDINKSLNKPTISYKEFQNEYYAHYIPIEEITHKDAKFRGKIIFGTLLISLLMVIYFCIKNNKLIL